MRIILAIAALIAASFTVHAQQIAPPNGPTGIACAYNSSPPTITSGNWAIAQCDSSGKLITSGSGGTLTWPGSAAVTNYGTAPTGTVPAVNAYITGGVAGGTVASPNIIGGSLSGTATVAPMTTYGLAIDCNTSSQLCTLIDSPIPAGSNQIGSVAQGTGAAVSASWPTEMVYSLSGTLTAVPGTAYGPDFDCNSSSTLCTLINSPLPTQASRGVNIGAVELLPNITPTDCSTTITTGGTAQTLIAAQTTLHGFTLANIDTSAGSGEPIWFSFTGTAAAATAGSYPLAAPTATTYANLATWTSPAGFSTNHAVSIIAATTGHKFSCTWW